MLREFFPELSGPWEAQAVDAPVCWAPCARPASLASGSLRGGLGLEPRVMAPGRREGGSILQGPSHSPLLQARAGGPVQKDAPPVSLGSSGLTSLLGNPMKRVGVTYLIQEGQVLGRG